jgi:hypothetical protein
MNSNAKSLRRYEGYLLIDHSVSPGTSEVPEGRKMETPTFICSHCNSICIIHMPRTVALSYCPKCDHQICRACDAIRAMSGGECRSFEKLIDQLSTVNPPSHLIGA